jgi:hypothetical protein
MQRDIEWANRVDACKAKDQETSHWEADNILCELLTSLGYVVTVAAWEGLPKWFA